MELFCPPCQHGISNYSCQFSSINQAFDADLQLIEACYAASCMTFLTNCSKCPIYLLAQSLGQLLSHYLSNSHVTEEVQLTKEGIGHILVERVLVLVMYPMLQGSCHQVLHNWLFSDGQYSVGDTLQGEETSGIQDTSSGRTGIHRSDCK